MSLQLTQLRVSILHEKVKRKVVGVKSVLFLFVFLFLVWFLFLFLLLFWK